jgi:phosphoribosyl 1,2-cyclic phosphate phosphodiesterase
MEITILGSGGCTVIPKPLCECHICREAREKGVPYARSGPAIFIHDENLLIDTPAEICRQLNQNGIERLRYLMFSHLDPDHVEGIRVVEQIALDFRDWRAYENKRIKILLPEPLDRDIFRLKSFYGSLLNFYQTQGYVKCIPFKHQIKIEEMEIVGVPVDRGKQTVFIYIVTKAGRKLIYAPCDIKPFPENRSEVQNADLLIIQPGIFETGLKHGFIYPKDHISRTTLYTFEQTLALAKRIKAQQVLFVHLEEYWNRGYDDYSALERAYEDIRFAHDGMRINL